jgi:protein-disulfide isomerase
MAMCSATPIPSKLSDVGWEIGNSSAPMRMEIFGDFQCPDTKAAWFSVVTSMRVKHADSVSIVFHPFPLPYHKNGFDSAQAAIVIADQESFVTTADTLFNQQDKFQTDATVNTTQAELFEDIFAPMAVSLGVEKSTFLAHMNNDDASNSQARVAWKFGAARGVTGTPTFSANGVVSDSLASWALPDWEKWLEGGN